MTQVLLSEFNYCFAHSHSVMFILQFHIPEVFFVDQGFHVISQLGMFYICIILASSL